MEEEKVGSVSPRRRRGSVSAAHRQNTWIMNWLVRIMPCAICGKSLAEGFNPRYPGKYVTLHHTNGNRETDRWEDCLYVAGMVLCHSTCHRSYHLSKRHSEAGRNTDLCALSRMERRISRMVKRQHQMVIP